MDRAGRRSISRRAANTSNVKGWRKPVKISARNLIKGKVVELKKGAVAAQVKVDIGGGNVLTSMITVGAVEDLGLEKGQEVSVIIKSTEIMIGR
jgi:molybdopterin-binding protein